jgi:Tol biopolymer transport system component
VDVPRIAWSPDGKWLAAGLKPEGGKDSAINLISVETGEKRPLTQPPSTFSDSGPAFSPNGQQIIFIRASISTANELYVVSHQGGDAAN